MSATTIEDLNCKAIAEAEAYLDRQGYTVLERSWGCTAGSIDLIAMEDRESGNLVFVDVEIEDNAENGLPTEHPDRERFEAVAVAYLSGYPIEPYVGVRFDIISIVVLGNHRAFLRHHRSALSLGD